MAIPQLNTLETQSANRGHPLPRAGTRYNELVQAGPIRQKTWVDPLVANTTGIHAAVTDNGAPQTIITGFVQPDYPRAVTATAGGTGADIKAIQVTVNGTDIEDNPIQEVLPVFTVDTPGTVQGNRAFKTITSMVIPAHDGTGATTALGFNEKLGFDRLLKKGNTVLLATADGVYETTRPTVVTDAAEISKNTIDINTALNGALDIVAYWIDTP